MKVKIEITSLPGRTDGYMEIVLGSLMFAGLIRQKPKMSKRTNGDNTTTITLEGDFNAAPLGHMGTDDIPDEN